MLKSFRWWSGAVKVPALTEDMYGQILGKFSGILAASTRRVTVTYYLSNQLRFSSIFRGFYFSISLLLVALERCKIARRCENVRIDAITHRPDKSAVKAYPVILNLPVAVARREPQVGEVTRPQI